MPANKGIMKINSALACTLKKKRKEEERCDLASMQTIISAHARIYYMCGMYCMCMPVCVILLMKSTHKRHIHH